MNESSAKDPNPNLNPVLDAIKKKIIDMLLFKYAPGEYVSVDIVPIKPDNDSNVIDYTMHPDWVNDYGNAGKKPFGNPLFQFNDKAKAKVDAVVANLIAGIEAKSNDMVSGDKMQGLRFIVSYDKFTFYINQIELIELNDQEHNGRTDGFVLVSVPAPTADVNLVFPPLAPTKAEEDRSAAAKAEEDRAAVLAEEQRKSEENAKIAAAAKAEEDRAAAERAAELERQRRVDEAAAAERAAAETTRLAEIAAERAATEAAELERQRKAKADAEAKALEDARIITEAKAMADAEALERAAAEVAELERQRRVDEAAAAQKIAEERAAAEKLAAIEAARVAQEKADAEAARVAARVAAEKAAAEAAAQKIAEEKLAAKKAAAQKIAEEKLAAEKLAAEKAAANKKEAELLRRAIAANAAEKKRIDEAENKRLSDEAEKKRVDDEAAAEKKRVDDEAAAAEKTRLADEAADPEQLALDIEPWHNTKEKTDEQNDEVDSESEPVDTGAAAQNKSNADLEESIERAATQEQIKEYLTIIRSELLEHIINGRIGYTEYTKLKPHINNINNSYLLLYEINNQNADIAPRLDNVLNLLNGLVILYDNGKSKQSPTKIDQMRDIIFQSTKIVAEIEKILGPYSNDETNVYPKHVTRSQPINVVPEITELKKVLGKKLNEFNPTTMEKQANIIGKAVLPAQLVARVQTPVNATVPGAKSEGYNFKLRQNDKAAANIGNQTRVALFPKPAAQPAANSDGAKSDAKTSIQPAAADVAPHKRALTEKQKQLNEAEIIHILTNTIKEIISNIWIICRDIPATQGTYSRFLASVITNITHLIKLINENINKIRSFDDQIDTRLETLNALINTNAFAVRYLSEAPPQFKARFYSGAKQLFHTIERYVGRDESVRGLYDSAKLIINATRPKKGGNSTKKKSRKSSRTKRHTKRAMSKTPQPKTRNKRTKRGRNQTRKK